MAYHYIISVSGKGILPADKKKQVFTYLLGKFGGMIAPITEELGLLEKGLNETTWYFRRDKRYPLTSKEIQETKKDFGTMRRNIEFYLLQKVE